MGDSLLVMFLSWIFRRWTSLGWISYLSFISNPKASDILGEFSYLSADSIQLSLTYSSFNLLSRSESSHLPHVGVIELLCLVPWFSRQAICLVTIYPFQEITDPTIKLQRPSLLHVPSIWFCNQKCCIISIASFSAQLAFPGNLLLWI